MVCYMCEPWGMEGFRKGVEVYRGHQLFLSLMNRILRCHGNMAGSREGVKSWDKMIVV